MEEVRGPHVGVTFGLPGVDRREVHGRDDAGVLEGRSHCQLGGDAAEAAPDLGDTEVADGESDGAVVAVEGPRAVGERVDSSRCVGCHDLTMRHRDGRRETGRSLALTGPRQWDRPRGRLLQ